MSISGLTKVIRCDQCRFAIPFIDPFTGTQRLRCGNDIEAINTFGDGELMSDRFGGCEFGERKDERVRTITTTDRHLEG